MFGSLSLPTPVLFASSLSSRHVELWVKHDGLTHPGYGGNKARKVPRLLDQAQARGASRILTFGAAGSHHVLTVTLFAKARGLAAAAVLTRQPVTPHVEQVLRASLSQGLAAHPAVPTARFPLEFARAYRSTDYVVPPGGSNVSGALAYVDAVGELAAQIAAGELPEPDMIVVACGSGGTTAGILAGLVRHGLKSRLLGVMVLSNAFARQQVLGLARLALRAADGHGGLSELSSRLMLETAELGDGYGYPTAAGVAALETARRELALELDLTYTAKAFARTLKALELVELAGTAVPRRVLYWHTLSSSSAPLAPEPLGEGAERVLAKLLA